MPKNLTAPHVIERVRQMRSEGHTIESICRTCHVSTHTAIRHCLGIVVPARVTPIKVKPVKPVKVRVLKPPKPLPVVKVPAGEFSADIARLRERERTLSTGLLASTRARSRLVREVREGLERANARAAMKCGRQMSKRIAA